MKKRMLTAVGIAIIMALSIAMPVIARQSRVYDGCYYDPFDATMSRVMTCDQFIFRDSEDREIRQIMDIGNGYTVYVFEPITVSPAVFEAAINATGIEFEPQNGSYAQFDRSSACNHIGHTSTILQEFHTVRTNPPPRHCLSVRFMLTVTCGRCWHTSTSSTTRPGCGENASC